MHYEFVAIPDEQVPQAADPLFRHLVSTYAGETNKTASVWRAIPDELLDYRPHEKTNTIRAILGHQILSERRFFALFVGTEEPPVEDLLPPGEQPTVSAYLDRHVGLAKQRLPQLAQASAEWWLEERPFFGGLRRQRIWTFWRRVLHTCHHRTQVQTWLRLAGRQVPAIYGPSGDVTWEEADPTYSVEAADRGAGRPQDGAAVAAPFEHRQVRGDGQRRRPGEVRLPPHFLFCLIDPTAFQRCFSSWMAALMARQGLTPIVTGPPDLRPIAIDGKAQRGSARRTVGRSALHVVSAWAVENRLTLGQVATDAKSNEITAIPELLALLDLKGAVVTIDAMGCQEEIAAEIIAGEGQYLLAVKENQPHLYEDIGRAFDEALEHGEPGVDFSECQTGEDRGGRRETRTCCVITRPRGIRDARLWAGLTAIVMVISHRAINGEASDEIRYFIGSVAGTAEDYLRWARGHWGIENALHWVLDVCFREDDQRHWAGNSAQNLGWLRKMALCLLKAEKESKGKSIATRRLLAGWKNDYLLSVLAQIPEKSDA